MPYRNSIHSYISAGEPDPRWKALVKKIRSSIQECDERSLNRASGERNSQWEALVKKLSSSTDDDGGTRLTSIPRVTRSKKTFPTGSTYKGTWNILGMSGYGVYTFSTGAVYEGHFDDGMFHGSGKLCYPNGTVIYGTWDKGALVERHLIFVDGVEYREDKWEYVVKSDRRYRVELLHGLQPSTKSHITPHTSNNIPETCYDAGDGCYNPKYKSVCNYTDHLDLVRTPALDEREWIIQNCRSGSTEQAVGPKPELYEAFYEPTNYLDPTEVIIDMHKNEPAETEEALRFARAKQKSLGFTKWREYNENNGADASQDSTGSI